MKPYIQGYRMISPLGLMLLLLLSLWTAPAHAAERPAKSKAPPQRFVTIDFNNVDINVFIKFISELTGKNFVIDQRVKGNVTIISPTKISITEAYRVFESVLEVHGYSAVRAGKVTKIVPTPDARSKNIETRVRAEFVSPKDRLVTQLMPLRYADPNEIKTLFTPLISKNSVIVAYKPTNMLIVTDIYSNIQRLMKILDAIDLPGIGLGISVVPLEYADAVKLVGILETVFQPKPAPKKGIQPEKATFVADERTNTIILLASEDDTFRIKQLIRMLDKETPRGKEKIRVYYLENATAEELAKVLSELPTEGAGDAKGKKGPPALSTDVKITADKATNSLVISAASDDYVIIEEIIKKLDIPRAMVYIEALIMEVRVGKDFRLGTEWALVGGGSIGGKDAAVGGGFTNLPGQSAISALPKGGIPSGFSLGIFTEAIEIAGVEFNNLSAVATAYQDDSDINILSTPQILTTDNEEARINIGENIPYQTRLSTSDNETFNTYEYRDVGITMTITPNISKDRLVRLGIALEVTNVSATSLELQPTTQKRTIDTTAIVKDNNTIVIGGLIDERESQSEFKVPILGDIPLLGWLFKSRGTTRDKTNLFVFLTPRVVQSPDEAVGIYGEKRGQIDKVREGEIKMFKEKENQAKPESES
ncbi:MAG: type II secretion system secretin GspD [Deltaproteobacteria bacterium]|nr:MAG: type II secretion system secretin GspD [Deltaproteobacteria bacterium]